MKSQIFELNRVDKKEKELYEILIPLYYSFTIPQGTKSPSITNLSSVWATTIHSRWKSKETFDYEEDYQELLKEQDLEEFQDIQYQKTLGYVASIDSTQTDETSFSTTKDNANTGNLMSVERQDQDYHLYRQSQSSDEVFCEAQNLLLQEKNTTDIL